LIGQTLSHYQITAAIGAGGMGEVYRATDTKLGRDVAIKILPPEVAQDPERLGRFDREAKLLASLNHPNIAAIYGLEEADGRPFLALELVEGEDLKERLARGAIPVDEALEVAEQIAEALEEAHGKGIVHRDLKPANVKLTPDGKVKVLDFGLAKAWGGDAASGGSSIDLSQSPTLARTGTLAGVILGTAAYMSPEQASGKSVDKRADIWSFGVVLFEMLTGASLFSGETASEVMASVIKEEPPWDRLPSSCPAAIARVLRRCLRKRPRERLQDIGDARLEIQEIGTGTADAAATPSGDIDDLRRTARRSRWHERAWAAALVAAAALAASVSVLYLTRAAPHSRAAHFVLDTPKGLSLPEGAPAVSPDGSQVVFAAAWTLFPQFNWGWFSASASGTLAYLEGQASGNLELTWFDRKGAKVGTVGKPGHYGQIALSPDEKRVAVELSEEGGAPDIWTVDVARGVATRQTFDPAADFNPVWSPDSRELAFTSDREGSPRLYRKALQANAPASPLAQGLSDVHSEFWSAPAKAILYVGNSDKSHGFGMVPSDGGAKPETVLKKSFRIDEPHVSPDGRWLAYTSQESSRWEVYVEPFRREGERVRVSTEGGGQPRWRGDGKELFYVSPDGQLMAVDVRTTGDRIDVGPPVALFSGVIADPTTDHYAATADGQRFLVPVPVGGNARMRIHVVTNWTSLLK
jgi:hypothetical protein